MSLTSNVITKLMQREQSRKINLFKIDWPDPFTSEYICQLDETASGSYYTFGGQNYTCKSIVNNTENVQGNEGQQETININIVNVDKFYSDLINSVNVVGSRVEYIRTFEGLSDNADFLDKSVYRINRAEYNSSSYTLILELLPLFKEVLNTFPLNVRDKNRCGWEFDADGTNIDASQGCGFYYFYRRFWDGNDANGYSIDTANYPNVSLTSCDRKYDSANGCLAHFNQNDITKPVLRFRAYLGLPTTPIRSIY